MKRNRKEKSLMTMAALVVGVSAYGQSEVPRGPDVGDLAGHCAIGPFPQTFKAGEYQNLCNTMPDAEKCLALIKARMNNDGSIVKVSPEENPRVEYCLETLKNELIETIGN